MEQKQLTLEQVPEYLLGLGGQLHRIEKILSEKNPVAQEPEQPIPIEAAARFLMKEVATIYTLVSKRKIPFHKKGRKLYFFKTELVSYIKKT